MNKHLLVLGLLATSTCAAVAAERPDGALGTDSIGAFGMYMNSSKSDGKNTPDFDYAGFGLDINKHLFKADDVGFDVSFAGSSMFNQNNRDTYKLDDHKYTFGVTAYKGDGAVVPYCKALVTYELFTLDYKAHPGREVDDDTIKLGGEIGAECHLLPGWSVTPYFSADCDTDADDNAWGEAFGVNTGYWFNDLIGTKLGAEYDHRKDSNEFYVYLGMSLHY
jgi:hypothetical protein